jgi:hypothetical protein
MATRKKAAKKAVPKVVEVKQIVLTQEQYEELRDIRFNLISYNLQLENAFSDNALNPRQIAFEIAKTFVKLDEQESKLGDLIDAIDPNPYNPWDEFEENVDEYDN